ncbi:hypothetical protein [Sphingomonas morindae]|nr:hypothetical protein [Sphingomonas morindae]
MIDKDKSEVQPDATNRGVSPDDPAEGAPDAPEGGADSAETPAAR